MRIKTLSVSQLNDYIKRILTSDPILYNLKVEGELSNLKMHSSGHIYFTLKDKETKINCIMFRGNSEKLKIKLSNGMKVVASGYISVYERDGQYQLYATNLEEIGLGNLHIAFEELKGRLEKEGLFDINKKKPLPELSKRIGIVTSPTGAVIRDIITVIKRRFPFVHLLVYPTVVQGQEAASSISKGIETFNKLNNVDVIIIARGGGSIEELWAFNEEIVARSIYNSAIPIVSAVGHETDFTISDFVADVRANTPSTAAELVVPNYKDWQTYLSILNNKLNYLDNKKVVDSRNKLNYLKNSYYFRYPLNKVYNEKQHIDKIHRDLVKNMLNILSTEKSNLQHKVEQLNNLSPLTILSRGYSITSTEENKVIKGIGDIEVDDLLKVHYLDGHALCKVVEVKDEGVYNGKQNL